MTNGNAPVVQIYSPFRKPTLIIPFRKIFFEFCTTFSMFKVFASPDYYIL